MDVLQLASAGAIVVSVLSIGVVALNLIRWVATVVLRHGRFRAGADRHRDH